MPIISNVSHKRPTLRTHRQPAADLLTVHAPPVPPSHNKRTRWEHDKEWSTKGNKWKSLIRHTCRINPDSDGKPSKCNIFIVEIRQRYFFPLPPAPSACKFEAAQLRDNFYLESKKLRFDINCMSILGSSASVLWFHLNQKVFILIS